MANTNLKEAKAAKNDEFYTQFHDIEIEMNAYLEYDPDVFRGKTVLLPCDDPEWSNFTRYFAAKFDELGLKKLISTSYAQSFHNLIGRRCIGIDEANLHLLIVVTQNIFDAFRRQERYCVWKMTRIVQSTPSRKLFTMSHNVLV